MSRLQLSILAAVALVAALALGLLVSNLVMAPSETAEAPSPAALVGGPFELVDQTGKTVTDADFKGKYMLIFFGFTSCPDVCPTELNTISAAMDLLGDDADKVQPIFITIDPARDTPQAIATYLGYFRPGIIGLTGSDAQIAAAARAYRVYYRKVEDEGSAATYTMDHSAVLYVMGPDGQFVTHVSPGSTPQEMAAKLRSALSG